MQFNSTAGFRDLVLQSGARTNQLEINLCSGCIPSHHVHTGNSSPSAQLSFTHLGSHTVSLLHGACRPARGSDTRRVLCFDPPIACSRLLPVRLCIDCAALTHSAGAGGKQLPELLQGAALLVRHLKQMREISDHL